MAFNTSSEAVKKLTLNLGNSLYGAINSLVTIKRQDRSKQEARFQQAVNDGMDYSQQAEFLQQQIDKERESFVPDKEAIDDWTTSLKNVRSLERFQAMRDEYFDVYDSYKTNRVTADKVVKTLEKQLENTSLTPSQRSDIRQQLSEMKLQSYKDKETILNNRIKLAVDDGSVSQIDNIVKDVEAKKRQAIIDGVDTSSFDLQIQNLNSERMKILHQVKTHDIANTMEAMTNPHEKLQVLIDSVNTADKSIPFTDPKTGLKYQNEQQYWTEQRDSYTRNEFFKEWEEFNKSWVDDVAKRNINGWVPLAVTDNIKKLENDYIADPYMNQFAEKISATAIKGLSEAAEYQANAAVASALMDLDWNGARQTIQKIQERTGVDMTSTFNQLDDLQIKRGSQIISSEDALAEMAARGMQTPPGEAEVISQADLQKQNTFQSQNIKEAARLTNQPQMDISKTGDVVGSTTNPALQGTATTETTKTPVQGGQTVVTAGTPQAAVQANVNQPIGSTAPITETPSSYVDKGAYTPGDMDALKAIGDSGNGNLLQLDANTEATLAKFYNKVPGLQDYVSQIKDAWYSKQKEVGDYANLPKNDLGNPIGAPYNAKLGGVLKNPTISGSKIKNLANKASNLSDQYSTKNIEKQPGYVKDLNTYNKQLMKNQGL